MQTNHCYISHSQKLFSPDWCIQFSVCEKSNDHSSIHKYAHVAAAAAAMCALAECKCCIRCMYVYHEQYTIVGYINNKYGELPKKFSSEIAFISQCIYICYIVHIFFVLLMKYESQFIQKFQQNKKRFNKFNIVFAFYSPTESNLLDGHYVLIVWWKVLDASAPSFFFFLFIYLSND